MIRNNGPVQTVQRASQILDLLQSASEAGASLTFLSRGAQLPPSTTHRLLKALEAIGFVRRGPKGQYQLGPRLLTLGLNVRDTLNIRHVVLPYMEELTAKTRETTYLSIVDDLYGISIEKIESPQNVRLFDPLGARVPLNRGASRKALLAFMPEDTIDRLKAAGLLVPTTPFTVTDPSVLRRQLAAIRTHGYASSAQENVLGACAVAVPLRDWSGRVVASLSIAAPRERLPKSRTEKLVALLVRTGAGMSRALGAK